MCVDCARGTCTISFFNAREQLASLRFCLQGFTAGQWHRYKSATTQRQYEVQELMAESSDPAQQFPNLPARILGLARLSYNVWWSWHREARELFPALDQQAWRESDHNPLRMLALVPQQTLDNAANDSRVSGTI